MKHFTALAKALSSMALLAMLAFHSSAQAPGDVRIALVIGNSAYAGNLALANPSNDAKDMAETLRSMGFGVVEVIDGNRAQMLDAVDRAGKALSSKQGVGMLFYAGHGLQLDWHNFMVPVDARLASAGDVAKQTVDIEAVMNTFKSAGNRMNIVVLDACRDNPFADGKTASGKGLAPLDAPTGTFLAYATAPGNVAQDGTGKNGLYTGFLLQELQKPNASIENVFKRVRFNVRRASDGAQIPWETTSLEDDFVFNSGIKKVVKLTDDQKDKEFEIEKAEWDKIKDSTSADPFYAFVQKYPTGMLTGSAQNVIERLNAAKTKAFTDKTGQIIEASSIGRFNVGDSAEYVRIDSRTKVELMRRNPQVIRIQDGRVYLRGGGIITTSGESIVDGGSLHSYDPPRANLPVDGLRVGNKWTARSAMTLGPYDRYSPGEKRWTESEGRVLAFETITVPAGTFKAYRIENVRINAWGYRERAISWISPDFGLSLKTIFEGRNVRGGGADMWTEEAVSITRGKPS